TGFGVFDDGTNRHFEQDVVALDAKHVGALAMLPALGLEATCETEIHQGIEASVGDRQQMPPAPTVAAIRATELLVLLVPERGAAIASVASCNIDGGF